MTDKEKTIASLVSVMTEFTSPENADVAIFSNDSDVTITGKSKFMRHKSSGMIVILPDETTD